MCRLFVTYLLIYLFQSIIPNGMFPRILALVVEWVKTHKQFGLEFEDSGSRIWVFVRTWRRDSFYRVAVGVIDRYHGDASSELVILGHVLCTIGSGASLVAFCGGSHTLVESYKDYLGSSVCAECWITRLSMSGCSNGARKKLLPLCLGRSIHFR